jgi:hypothetical protein
MSTVNGSPLGPLWYHAQGKDIANVWRSSGQLMGMPGHTMSRLSKLISEHIMFQSYALLKMT